MCQQYTKTSCPHTHTEIILIWQQRTFHKTKIQIHLRTDCCLKWIINYYYFIPPFWVFIHKHTLYISIHKLPHLKLTCAVLEFGTSTLGLSMAPPFTEVAWPTPCQHKYTLTMTSVTLEDPKQPHHASVSPTEQDADSVEHSSALKYYNCVLVFFLSLSTFHFFLSD